MAISVEDAEFVARMFFFFEGACCEDSLLCWMYSLESRNVFCKIGSLEELGGIFFDIRNFSNLIVGCCAQRRFDEDRESVFYFKITCLKLPVKFSLDSGGTSPRFFQDWKFGDEDSKLVLFWGKFSTLLLCQELFQD